MAKKVYINEHQLNVLVQYIKEGKEPVRLTEENILEEGFKEWAVAGLMALASIGGVKAQDTGNLTQKHIEAAEAVQNKLKSGDLDGDGVKDLKQYFTQANIDLNQENLSKLMKADTSDAIQTYKTRSASSARAKLGQGYTMTDIQVSRDTVWKDIPQPATMDSAVGLQFDGNVFETGGFDLNQEVASELDYLVQKIQSMNGNVKSINIEASTDKEPIKMGNEKLAQLRADGIKDYLASLGIDTSTVNIITKPEQGPDVYSTTMSDKERQEARQQTEEFRYVKVEVVFEHDIPAPLQDKEVSHVIERIQYELVRVKPEYGTIKRIKRKGGGTTTKKFKCKVNPGKGKPIPCFEF